MNNKSKNITLKMIVGFIFSFIFANAISVAMSFNIIIALVLVPLMIKTLAEVFIGLREAEAIH